MRPTAPLALLLAALPARAQVCTPSAPAGASYRQAMTHRAPGPATAGGISVATFQSWSPPDDVEHAPVRERNDPIDARERRAATLEGDLWRVKVGDNGCDLTLELSATGAGRDSPHVVAAIPAGPGYEAARGAILAAVGRRAGRSSRRADLAEPVHVRLTGYLFWDGGRWCAENPGRGCGPRADIVASLWELHPVWRVDVPGSPAPRGDERPAERRHHGHRRPAVE